MSRRLHVISWLLGVAALAGVVWYFRPEGFLSSLQRVGIAGGTGWFVATFVSRLLLAEIPTQLLRALGYRLHLLQLFSIGWLRTFSNQIVPLTGIAVFVQQLRQKSGASWQDLAASASQQAFIGFAALGVVGCAAVLFNTEVMRNATLPLLLVFGAVGAVALGAALGVTWVIGKLPGIITKRVIAATESFDRLASSRALMLTLVGVHTVAILLRGARVWMLFAVLGIVLDWREALLIVAFAEATVLIAVTPGGLGIREVLIVGGAALLGISTDAAVAISLIDRLFVVSLTGIMAVPAALYLGRKPEQDAGYR